MDYSREIFFYPKWTITYISCVCVIVQIEGLLSLHHSFKGPRHRQSVFWSFDTCQAIGLLLGDDLCWTFDRRYT